MATAKTPNNGTSNRVSARQRYGKHVSAAIYTDAVIRNAVFSVKSAQNQ